MICLRKCLHRHTQIQALLIKTFLNAIKLIDKIKHLRVDGSPDKDTQCPSL